MPRLISRYYYRSEETLLSAKSKAITPSFPARRCCKISRFSCCVLKVNSGRWVFVNRLLTIRRHRKSRGSENDVDLARVLLDRHLHSMRSMEVQPSISLFSSISFVFLLMNMACVDIELILKIGLLFNGDPTVELTTIEPRQLSLRQLSF